MSNSKAIEAIGWAYADCCAALDRGEDPRQTEMPGVLERAKRDLGLFDDPLDQFAAEINAMTPDDVMKEVLLHLRRDDECRYCDGEGCSACDARHLP